MLNEMHGEVAEQGQIEPVQPDHWARAVLAMVVEVPGRGQDHVTAVHVDTFAVHGRETAVALDDEAHRECDVAVSRGGLVGHN